MRGEDIDGGITHPRSAKKPWNYIEGRERSSLTDVAPDYLKRKIHLLCQVSFDKYIHSLYIMIISVLDKNSLSTLR